MTLQLIQPIVDVRYDNFSEDNELISYERENVPMDITMEIRKLGAELDVFISQSLKVYSGVDNRRKLLYMASNESDLLIKLEQMLHARNLHNEAMTKDDDYVYKTKPYAHQKDVFIHSRDKKFYGLFMEQGTGKSKVVIDTMSYMYQKGLIEAVLIIAPNGVKPNWRINEIPIHMPDETEYMVAEWFATPKKLEKKMLSKVYEEDTHKLRILIANVEALGTPKFKAYCKSFLLKFKNLTVIDESSKIKTPSAKRTKFALEMTNWSNYRRILTGTPITQGPLDLWTQFNFLSPEILQQPIYTVFKNRYAVIQRTSLADGRTFDHVVGYRNVDSLVRQIRPYSYRVLKSECLDLPDKIYQRFYVQMTTEQERIYTELKTYLVARIGEAEMSTPIILTQLLRLQQVIGGFYKLDDESSPRVIEGNNSRMDAVREIVEPHIEEKKGKVIIWARFTAEVKDLCSVLKSIYGDNSVVAYYGAISNEDRNEAVRSFQDPDSEVKFFIGNPEAAGIGLTLTQANLVIYYSNSFSLESRLQSEDRCHRIGQKSHIVYVDIECQGTIDSQIITALRNKKSIADVVNEDPEVSWL